MAAELTIDATGQDALFGRSFRTREYNTALRHVALYGHWSGGRDLHEVIGSDDAKDAGNILIVTVPDGWIWHIPIAHSMRSVVLVTDPAAVANLSAASPHGLLPGSGSSVPRDRRAAGGGRLGQRAS